MKDPRLRKSRQQEQRVARRVGGSVNPGSGSSWRRPHDVREQGVLWEMKRTDGKSMTLHLEVLEAVTRRALLAGDDPVLHLEFGTRRFVVLHEEDYFDLKADDHGRNGGRNVARRGRRS
jgi:hypothetical protein